jgi:phage terminase large subunit-like protein
VGFFSDLHPWESYVDKWSQEHGRDLCARATVKHPIAFDMRGNQKLFTTEGAELVHNEIEERTFKHDGDPRLRQHVHNARRRPNAWGYSFAKEHRESRRKVDGLAALILARMARRSYLLLPASKQRRKRQKASFF